MTPVHVASDAAVEAAARAAFDHAGTRYEAAGEEVLAWEETTEDAREYYRTMLRRAINAAWAVDAPDDTDLATRVRALADDTRDSGCIHTQELGIRIRALVGEATGPTLHDRIEALIEKGSRYGVPHVVEVWRLRDALEAHDTGDPQ